VRSFSWSGATGSCERPDHIAYPVIHKSAGGTGTYYDPITAASGKAELAVGTKIYVPFLHRYFILEDDRTEVIRFTMSICGLAARVRRAARP
jgi:hypothetical protein